MGISTRSRQRISLLICCFIILVKSKGSEAQLVYKSVVESASAEGAVCLDGSPPAYILDRGSDEGAQNWLVYVQGGGWCINNTNYDTADDSVQSCTERATGELGSSFLMKPMEFNKSVFGNESRLSYFYNWNRVILKYCDGGSFLGDVDQPDPDTKLYYRGARIFKALTRYLMENAGLKDAQNVLLAGGSAGGVGVMAHCDNFRSLFPDNVRVKCLADSSLFLRVNDPKRAEWFQGLFSNVVGLHKPEKALPTECTSKMDTLSCFFPKNLVQYVKTPIFIINPAQDSFQVRHTFWEDLYLQVKNNTVGPADMALLKDFRQQIISALPQQSDKNGYIITSRFGHSLGSGVGYKLSMFADPSSKSFETALVDWFFDRSPANFIDPREEPFYT
ncbi:unnamed protein product [Cuscuta epithymum]|uniref:Pectin acetylesterase n=1 Tax=Cuscuta epithymum TaxID=186058 RepID=A0AAV0C5C3_9ASTE|nr:unnamed protein product [Cuscuta epithymum]